MIREMDVYVPMRDGVKLCVDVYRPETDEKLPALLAFAIYNKDFQGPDMAEALPPQPAWTPLWTGPLEAGDTHFLVSRGYVHVIGSPRGVGKSEGGGSREWDSYDLIEWIAAQPWCDGNVGMVGISGFGAEQFHVAKQQPPHLKAIFPFDPRGAYGVLGGFREEYPGGVLHLFRYLVGHFAAMHQHRGAPGKLPEPKETYWREAMANPDYRMYPNIFNLLAQKGQHMPPYFDLLIDPYDKEEVVQKSEADLAKIKVPSYTGSGWYGYTYKTHLNGAQSYFANIDAPKKLMFTGPAHLERPFRSFHHEILKWYDHWLKGIDTGVMREPPVKFWVMGENKWRQADDWPLPETQWTKLYLRNWERLSPEPFIAGERRSVHAAGCVRADAAEPDQRHPEAALSERAAAAGRADRGTDRAEPVRRHRPGRHQLDRRPQGCRPRRVGHVGARGRARTAEEPARARDHARMAQGLASRARSEALEAVEAVASAHARGAASRWCRARSTNTRSRSWRPPTCSGRATASASRSPASICPPASPARPTRSTFRITSAAARRCCTGSITTPNRPSHLLLPVIPNV